MTRAMLIAALALIGLLLPAASQISSGPSAHYAAGYSRGDWLGIYNQQAAWGNAVGPPAGAGEYWCAHAGYDVVGVRLLLLSGGAEFVCVTGDTVQPAHKQQWYAKWAIEASWALFSALPDPGYVEVYAYQPRPSVEELAPEPEAMGFAETPYLLANGFLEFWLFNGGLPVFGLPLSDEHACRLETGEQGVCQWTERARLELHPDGAIRLGRLGAEALGLYRPE